MHISQKYLDFLFVFIGCLAISVSGQCLTENDHMGYVGTPDLSPILGFEIDLFKDLLPWEPRENFFISPYSIWNALVLAFFGSAHETQAQLAHGLRITDKLSTLKLYRELGLEYHLRSLDPESSTFVIANKAYFNKSIDIRPCMKGILHSEIEKLNFNRPFESVAVINGFVENVTHGKIRDLCKPEDVLNSNMALVNAAYFKGTWRSPFDPSRTTMEPFTTFDGYTSLVPMMRQIGSFYFGYDRNLESEILELPYSGEAMAMYIFLPFENSPGAFDHLITALNPQTFDSIVNNTGSRNVDVSIPKFSMETIVEENLIQALVRMGITDAFDRKHADFREFSTNGYFTLDRGVHKAFVEVNEEGTEAAAATAVISTKMGGRTVFACNRPFLFVIRDTLTHNNLFMGVYRSPTESADQHQQGTPQGNSRPRQVKQNRFPLYNVF